MAFDTSTAHICRELGIVAGRTLLRRRKGTKSSPPCPPDQQFFEFGVHWIFRSPGSRNVLWDRDKTIAAWLEAHRVYADAFREEAEAEV